MARTKTIHTQAAETNRGASYITFPAAEISDFSRFDPTSGVVKFRCPLNGKELATLFGLMGWQVPGAKSSLEKLDGKLDGGTILFKATAEKLKVKSSDGTVDPDAEVDLEYKDISDFQCHRFEIKGKKGKGFRRELRFTMTFAEKASDSCANLESYMNRTGNAPGSLKVTYFVEPVQRNLVPDDVTPPAEADPNTSFDELREKIANDPKRASAN